MRRALLLLLATALAGADDAPLACPCGLGATPWPKAAPAATSDLRWLHVPKVGASFALSVARAFRACDGVKLKGVPSAMRSCEGRAQAECLLEALAKRSRRCRDAVAAAVDGHAPLEPDRAYAGLFREPGARLASLAHQAATAGSLRGAKRRERNAIFARAANLTAAGLGARPELRGCAARVRAGFSSSLQRECSARACSGKQHPRFETVPRDDRSSKNRPKRVENGRERSL